MSPGKDETRVYIYIYIYIYENCKIYFLRFAIFEIIFIFLLWNKNFKRMSCAKARLLYRLIVSAVQKTSDLKILQYSQENTCAESLFIMFASKFFIK